MKTESFDFSNGAFKPLSARMRPTQLEHYFGQAHLLGEGKPLRKAIESRCAHSMILWLFRGGR